MRAECFVHSQRFVCLFLHFMRNNFRIIPLPPCRFDRCVIKRGALWNFVRRAGKEMGRNSNETRNQSIQFITNQKNSSTLFIKNLSFIIICCSAPTIVDGNHSDPRRGNIKKRRNFFRATLSRQVAFVDSHLSTFNQQSESLCDSFLSGTNTNARFSASDNVSEKTPKKETF